MTRNESIASADAAASRATSRLRHLATWVDKWFRTCADYYAAAATYEQLSRLSDAELRRRGLDRATLARDLCQSPERSSRR